MRESVFNRRHSIAALAIACVAMTVLPACQQGNAPLGGTLGSQFGGTSGTPMGSAFGSSTVMPASTGNLGANPFSPGPTRVTPPPTGSIGSAAALGTPVPGATNGVNPYLGAQNFGTQNTFQSGVNQAPFGSGVSQASRTAAAAWTETASNIANGVGFGNPVNPSLAASNSRDPARSGMRVIDMTGSANPPGYRPTPNSAGFAGNYPSQPNFNVQTNPQYSPVPPVQIASASPPAFRGSQAYDPSYNAPASFQQQRPADPQRLPSPVRDSAANSVPSTEPLQWRRPGTGF